MSFDCFVGHDYSAGDTDIVIARETVETFPEARRWMAAKLLPFVDEDSCLPCQVAGTKALIKLIGLESWERFAAEVDGEQYVIASRSGEHGPGPTTPV